MGASFAVACIVHSVRVAPNTTASEHKSESKNSKPVLTSKKCIFGLGTLVTRRGEVELRKVLRRRASFLMACKLSGA
jgi:hypothetical protein